MIRAVFFDDIVDDLLTVDVAKVDIKVGHTDPFRIEKPFKKQIIPKRINARNADAVCRKTAGSRTSSGTYGNVFRFGKTDKVMHNQIIVHIAHFVDNRKLVFEPVDIILRRIFADLFVKPVIALPLEIFKVILAVRHLEMRKLGFAEFKFDVAHFGDFSRIVYGVLSRREKRTHFFFAFQVKFGCAEFKPRILAQGVVCADAD